MQEDRHVCASAWPQVCQPQKEVKVRSLQPPKETQGSLELLTLGTESEKFQGDREASGQGEGQGEVRTEEEDRATLQTAGWRSQCGAVLSTAYPGMGSTLSAMGDVAELYSEGQHYQTCLKKNPFSCCRWRTDCTYRLLWGEEGW